MKLLKPMILLFLLGIALPVEKTEAVDITTDILDPDTAYVVVTQGSSGTNSVVPISFVNDELLSGIELTLTWNSPLITLDSVSFVGGRVDYLGIKGATMVADTVMVYCFPFGDPDIPVGTGLLCNLFYTHEANLGPLTIDIDSTHVIDGAAVHANWFSDSQASQFVPQFEAGQLIFSGANCCIGDRGNVNYSPIDEPDISDLTYMVEYFFGGGPAPPCMLEANIDGSVDEQVDISDLTYLVSFYFEAGPPPAACP
ncbi:MAG: hypothetical protein P1R58_00860 [bacterium]|nr:hypothetical protein [bacterium]